jgi:hypothetical protein
MNIESLGRQAIERIKSEWGLPKRGFLAGGSIANIVWELVSGNKAVVSDIDVFIFDSLEERVNTSNRDTLFNYQEKETRYYEDYTGMCFNTYTKDFYSIIEAEREGMFNNIRYKSNSQDPSLIIKSFDINSTRIGYSIEKDELYWTPEFEEFLKTGELKVTNLMTPSHTAIRIVKKSKDLNVKLDEFEFKLIQYALSCNFQDRIKLRFRERYLDLYKEYSEQLKDFFTVKRDFEAEDYVKIHHQKEVQLFYLSPIVNDESTEISDFDRLIYAHRSNLFKEDENINLIFKSSDFLFYMRNIYGKEELSKLWKKLYFYFKDINYIDKEVSMEDIELLCRFSENAPNSIENLKSYKLSEQISIIKKFLDKYKEDPIIAISILENVKINKDIELDEQTSLLLELSVRKQILNDTRGKVNKILDIKEELPKVIDLNKMF